MDEIVGRVLDETQSLQEIQGILAAVSKRLTPQLETDPCKVCQRVGSACNAFRGTLTGANQDKFDSTVVTAVGKSHQAVRSWGLQISREKWRKATGKDGGATKSRRGRPSKVNDPKVVQKVVECIVAHTQESSIWLKAENCKARTLTCSLQRAYWDGKLASVVAWKQFHTIVRTQCRWAIKPTRRTDFCDHCHLFETCIEPGMVKLTTQVQNALRRILPNYFDGYTFPEIGSDPTSALEAMRRYINSHNRVCRAGREAALNLRQRHDLHTLEAKILHHTSWEIQVAKSYQWHRLISKRQRQAMQNDLATLTEKQALLWSDFKQNLSVPVAQTQTSTMFYGTSRMELTCWGCIVFRKKGGDTYTKNIVVLSSIIEHSCLVSNLLYEEVSKHIDDFQEVSEILVWSDCGPHYKAYDHVAGWIGNFVEAPQPRSVRLQYFAEKHGKGQVDGLFAQVEAWIASFLKTPGSCIASIDEMEKVLAKEAARATKLDPRMSYCVIRWEPEHKPPAMWVLQPPVEFQISKTYCLEIRPGNPHLRVRNTLLVDRTFSDVSGQEAERVYPKAQLSPISDPSWRRGFFASKRWDRQKPKRDQADAVVSRFEEHIKRKMPQPDLEREWDGRARRRSNKLLRRREKFAHLKGSVTAASSTSSSTSSSSTSDSDL